LVLGGDAEDGDVVVDLVVPVLDDTEGGGDLVVPVLGDTEGGGGRVAPVLGDTFGDGTLYGRL
jgi:hypothetical protein